MLFISEDGEDRKWFEFSKHPVAPEVQEEFAVAFVHVIPPLGTYKQLASAENFDGSCAALSRWITTTRPNLGSLAQLSRADAAMLAKTCHDSRQLSTLRKILNSSPVVTEEVKREIAQPRTFWTCPAPRQPYTDAEMARICIWARGVVRRARDRIYAGREVIADFRTGKMDHLPERDPLRCLGLVLDHCERLGDIPRRANGGRRFEVGWAAHARVTTRRDLGPMAEINLTAREVFAFTVLLAALAGLNASTLRRLKAPHLRATGEGEVGVALVDLHKPRRHSNARWTFPLSALPAELRPVTGERSERKVRETSLTTAYGVFCLLLDLTEPGRRILRTDRALVYHSGRPSEPSASPLRVGLPRGKVAAWFESPFSPDPPTKKMLLAISMDRLRKTRLEVGRKPIAHTPATFHQYLRRMDKVTDESYQIVKEVLDKQVASALARRQMTVTTTPDLDHAAAGSEHDTVLGSCEDFQHSPLDDGGPCRQTFMTCLDCRNARAFPRHLPFQLLVHQTLLDLRTTVSAERWAVEFAGRAAQVEAILNEYEPAQRQQAQAAITDTHRRIVERLFHGDLDPL